ncbi:MAG TPA: hypothetical protein VIX85_02745 [Acidimicrobiales bacterium]
MTDVHNARPLGALGEGAVGETGTFGAVGTVRSLGWTGAVGEAGALDRAGVLGEASAVTTNGAVGVPSRLVLGSSEHQELFCRLFVETHVSYDVESIAWPTLSSADRQFLGDLPIWDEAVNTEHETAVLVRAMADYEPDPMLAEAIGLQAYEEERHSALVTALTDHYGIDVRRRPTPRVANPEWAFLKSGWGECIDSFFAFGIFDVAQQTGLVPPRLLAMFDLVMREEARHILFFENWRLAQRHSAPAWDASLLALRSAVAASLVVLDRLRLAATSSRDAGGADQNFLLSGAKAIGALTPRAFVDICLGANDRRFRLYDQRLVRPRIVPGLARRLRSLLPDRSPGRGGALSRRRARV